MAIYTQEKLDEMVDARTRIGMGGNPVKITIDGNSTEYGPGNISLLNTLIAKAEAQLDPDSIDDGIWQPESRKGF